MKGDAKVIDHLNLALRLELTAVNQYWLHFRLLEDWGYTKLAKKERAKSIEEMHHADRLADRIIFLDGFPNMQQLNPLKIGQNIKEVLESDLAGEYEARTAYSEAREICRVAGDLVSMKLFEVASPGRGRPHRLHRDPTRPPRRYRTGALRPAPGGLDRRTRLILGTESVSRAAPVRAPLSFARARPVV